MARTAGMAQFSECFCLDLSDSFTCNAEFLTNFLKGTASAVIESEAKFDYVLLSGSKGSELTLDDLTAHSCGCGICGGGGLIIGDEVTEMAVFLFTYRCFERNIHLNISNKKLVDRATRMIRDLCGVDYETANYELFYSKLMLESLGRATSTTVEPIDRLGMRNSIDKL